MMPGFVDVHTDVVPYLVSGLLLDAKDGNATKVNGLLDRRRKKLNLISDDRIAAEIFQRFIVSSIVYNSAIYSEIYSDIYLAYTYGLHDLHCVISSWSDHDY